MNQHKLSLESLLEGAPVVLPYELTMSLKPGFGEYVTDPGKSGSGVTVTIRRGQAKRSEHYPNRYQAWQRAQSLMGRAS